MTVTETELVSDPSEYGRPDQPWNEEFVNYIVTMVKHPVYSGMPDAIKDDGKVQWEAPSNRPPGKYQHTHHKRRDWWREKAKSIGIDPESDVWISRTAKQIHPTGQKPCKRCGRVMRIAYVYPNGHLLRRMKNTFPELDIDPLEPFPELVQRMVDELGIESLRKLPQLVSTRDVAPPEIGLDLDGWISWIEDSYIPSEPSMLSPGAMSNAPDRFDGFHSFNLCCRSSADSGRHDQNMRSYTTDRRVFEYWSEGNWIAADRLMGLVTSRFREEASADGGDPPSTADHIGPLSLGFLHRPEFRLLSRSANSAKNNRMTLWDVQHLIKTESKSQEVISWFGKPLWDMRKFDVHDEETALRLSKLLRDNHRNAMHQLGEIMQQGFYTFLAKLLALEHANNNIEFVNLRIEDFVTVYDSIIYTDRKTKYANEQKARRLRIGFEALRTYISKDNRHLLLLNDKKIEELNEKILRTLSQSSFRKLDEELRVLLDSGGQSESQLRRMSEQITDISDDKFADALNILREIWQIQGVALSALWESPRYVRTTFDFDSD